MPWTLVCECECWRVCLCLSVCVTALVCDGESLRVCLGLCVCVYVCVKVCVWTPRSDRRVIGAAVSGHSQSTRLHLWQTLTMISTLAKTLCFPQRPSLVT